MLSWHDKYTEPSSLFPKWGTQGSRNICFSLMVNIRHTLFSSMVPSPLQLLCFDCRNSDMQDGLQNKPCQIYVSCCLQLSHRFKTNYTFGFITHIIRIACTMLVLIFLFVSFLFWPYAFDLSYSKFKTQEKFRNIIGNNNASRHPGDQQIFWNILFLFTTVSHLRGIV
jgi:hypothetical protein